MLTNAIEVMSYIKASAGRSNLGVVFESKNHPRHDGSTIYLPKITASTTQEEMIEMMASTDHEVAHDRYSDFEILKEKKIDVTKSVVGYVWNFIEDSRVNYIEAKEYAGFRELWEQSTPQLLDKIRIASKSDESLITKLVAGLIRWDAAVSGDMFPLCAAAGFKFSENKKIATTLKKFDKKLIACQNEIEKVKGSAMTYELAREIVIALGGNPDEEPPKPKSLTEENEESEETEKKKSKERKEGEKEESSKKVKEGKSEEEEKEEEDWCIKEVEIKESDVDKLVTRHELDKTKMSKVGLMYSVDKENSSWAITPIDNFVVVNYSKNKLDSGSTYSTTELLNTHSSSANFFEASYHERIVPSLLASENFAQQIRKEIQIRFRVRYEYGIKKGKLDVARLARIVTKAPGYSERVFKKKVDATSLDAAISVLIDMSGSMSGDKALYAAGSAILVNKVCQVLGVAVEIAGFTDIINSDIEKHAPLHYLYKPFNTAMVREEELLRYIGASSTHMTGNPDGENILYAYYRLVKRKEKKKLLIVMSDGQPAASGTGRGLGGFTSKVIEEIEKLKKVDIYGLGLLSKDVTRYYKNHSVVNNVAEIPIKLLELIERKLFV